MQDAELLAKRPSDNEQWFNYSGQIGQVFDQLPNRPLSPLPDFPPLKWRGPSASLVALIGEGAYGLKRQRGKDKP